MRLVEEREVRCKAAQCLQVATVLETPWPAHAGGHKKGKI